MTISFQRLVASALFAAISLQGVTYAHFPWLSTDRSNHAMMWFGESTDDRTYAMPASIQEIELFAGADQFETKSVESDGFVGLISKLAVDTDNELAGSVVYGSYHGTLLTYHVEHLPQRDASQWPKSARPGATLQTVISPASGGGVDVQVLHDGKPLGATEVKLFCEEGHEEAARETDRFGKVSFTASEVEPGLNALLVGVTGGDDQGADDGEDTAKTSDYLTSTFFIAKRNSESSSSTKPASPRVMANQGVSVAASGLPDLPEELTSFGAAIANGTLYVFGGHTGSAHSYSREEQSDRLWSLKLTEGDSATWQKETGGPTLQGLALVPHGQNVVRIGGFTAVNEIGEGHDLRSQSTVAQYDTATKTWKPLPSLPEPRSSLDAAVLDGRVYVFGGWKLAGESAKSEWHETAWSLDLSDADATWQALAPSPLKRRAISVAAHDGKLFIIGGMQAAGGPTTRVHTYDPKSDRWAEGPAIPGTGMSGFGSASFATKGRLYVSTMDGFVHRLNQDGKAWTTVAKTDPARFFHRMLPQTPGKLLMIGGANMEEGKFTAIDAIEISDVQD